MGKFFMGLLAGIAGTIGTCLVINNLDSMSRNPATFDDGTSNENGEDTIPAETEDSQE